MATQVRFSADGKQLFSGGGGDACVLHWAVSGATSAPTEPTARTPRVSATELPVAPGS
jgi:hypothetical protein